MSQHSAQVLRWRRLWLLLRPLVGARYPYWWQALLWMILARVRSDNQSSGRDPLDLRTSPLLVLARTTRNPWGGSRGLTHQTRALVDHVRQHSRGRQVYVIEVGTSFAVSYKVLFRTLKELACGTLVVTDPRLCGGLGPRGVFRAWRIGRGLSRLGIDCLVVSWDVYDPQHALITNCLTRGDGNILLLASPPDTANCMRIRGRALGPAPEAVVALTEIDSPGGLSEWERRQYDVFVAPLGRGERDQLTLKIAQACTNAGLTILQPPSWVEFSGYRSLLKTCRVVVVSNEVHPDYVRFHSRDCVGPAFHFVGRNFEAIASGALLVTQDCREARMALKPLEGQLEQLFWSDPSQIGSIVRGALRDSPASQVRREAAYSSLRQLTQAQSPLTRALHRTM